MIAESSLLGPHLQAFFSQYLRVQKRASPETVASYRRYVPAPAAVCS